LLADKKADMRTTTSASIVINRSPAEVFAGLTNFSQWPQWQGGLISVDQITPGPLQAGSQLQQVRSSGNPKESLIEVTRLVPDQMLGVKSPSPPLAWQGMFTLEPLDADTRFGLEFKIEASGLTGLIGYLIIRLTLKQELKTFKALVETGGIT
jgi:hypothetical protein